MGVNLIPFHQKEKKSCHLSLLEKKKKKEEEGKERNNNNNNNNKRLLEGTVSRCIDTDCVSTLCHKADTLGTTVALR